MKRGINEKSLDELIREELDNMQEGRPKSSRTKSGKKVPGKYLTKDKAAMKGEIERVSKLKSDDPDAYGKWKADYKSQDTKTGKPHKTKKSAATIAYEKRFGKKNENVEKMDNLDDIESEIEMMLRPTDDRITHDELQDIANAYGVDFEDVTQVMNSYVSKREKERQDELESVIRNVFINDERHDFTDGEMWDFWVKNGYGEDMPWVDKKEFQKVVRKLTSDPNQLSLFTEDVDTALANKAKASGISKSILRAVYSKGAAAWKSGHRPGVSQQQWAMGRVNSFLTGKGGSRKVDAKLWARAKKSKKRKNESVGESELRSFVRSVLSEIYDEKGVGTHADLAGPDVTGVLPYSDLVTAIAKKWGWEHDLTQQVAYALEIKNPEERERRIIALLNDYDVYDGFAHYLRMNEGGGLDELYPLMVGEDNVDEGIGKYVAGAALGLGLALGSPGKAMAQDVSKDNVNKPKIVKTFQNLKKSVFDKKIEPEPDEDNSQNNSNAAYDSLKSQVGKVQKTSDGKYSTVEMETFNSMGEQGFASRIAASNAQHAIATAVKGKEVSPGRTVTKSTVPDTQIEERNFQNPDGTYTVFVKVTSSVN